MAVHKLCTNGIGRAGRQAQTVRKTERAKPNDRQREFPTNLQTALRAFNRFLVFAMQRSSRNRTSSWWILHKKPFFSFPFCICIWFRSGRLIVAARHFGPGSGSPIFIQQFPQKIEPGDLHMLDRGHRRRIGHSSNCS